MEKLKSQSITAAALGTKRALSAFRAPSDDREHELLKIWQEVLKIPNIGVDDDFFELGGTSLQALMVFSEN